MKIRNRCMSITLFVAVGAANIALQPRSASAGPVNCYSYNDWYEDDFWNYDVGHGRPGDDPNVYWPDQEWYNAGTYYGIGLHNAFAPGTLTEQHHTECTP